MTIRNEVPSDPLAAFVASTQEIVALLEASEPAQLAAGLTRQIASFEALSTAISAGRISDSSELTKAIDAGRAALGDVRKRMQGVRKELDGLRSARARTARRQREGPGARFVSQRV